MSNIGTNRNDVHGGDIDAIARQLGLDFTPEIHCDFSVNLNPIGVPELVSDYITSGNYNWIDYPEANASTAIKYLAASHDIKPEMVTVGNGATELFALIIQAFKIKQAFSLAPCYSGYREASNAVGVECTNIFSLNDVNSISRVPSQSSKAQSTKLNSRFKEAIFIGYPNNPTGTLPSHNELSTIISDNPQLLFIIDESFMDFIAQGPTFIGKVIPANVVIVKSLTKMFSIAGIRLGMAVSTADNISQISCCRLPWSINAAAQGLAPLLYADQDFITQSQIATAELRTSLINELGQFTDIEVFPSRTNFILLKCSTRKLQLELFEKGIFIRSCEDIPGLGKGYYRIAVKNVESNAKLITALSGEPIIERSRDKAIMIVGTTSNAGKSLVTAALCRYFLRKGQTVAPYKAQNMALNSFVTEEGGEMGRAQVVQAAAAKIKPHTDMNPVLLKPLGDSRSQLIVDGKAVENLSAREYYSQKKDLRYQAWAAYDRLAERYDKIIMEGAGSPAEINLLEHDFVNMAAAEHANAKTILVADIDRGGVFASIFGTIKMLPDKYQKLISGIIINKFRGDVSLLDSGIEKIERMTGVPVIGVMPYIKDLKLEEEDSLGLEDKNSGQANAGNQLDIAVIRLPRMSNYTDFLPLETASGVSLRYVSSPRELGLPDLIIIPGTKNTCSDMTFLRESGFEIKIKFAHTHGVPIVGICGGYQMLGQFISDPHSVEGDIPQIDGLGFLPTKTTLHAKKELAQVRGVVQNNFPFVAAGTEFHGYEIHAGETVSESVASPLHIHQRRQEECLEKSGSVSTCGRVFGCYIHGLFDSAPFLESFVTTLMKKKGLTTDSFKPHDPDKVYEQLADAIESHIDLSKLR